MFVSVTPIRQDTGVPSGQPIWVNIDQIATIELIAQTQNTVAFTRILLNAPSASEIFCWDPIEVILPVTTGSNFRS